MGIYVHVSEGSVHTFHYSLERICGTQDTVITGLRGLSGYRVFSLKAGKHPGKLGQVDHPNDYWSPFVDVET